MDDTNTQDWDFVCTRCFREFNLGHRNHRRNFVDTCEVCYNRNRCCFVLARSDKWDGIDVYSKWRFYETCPAEYSAEYKQKMWEDGVEINMGILLYFVCNNVDDLTIPVDIVRTIYGFAKQIPRRK